MLLVLLGWQFFVGNMLLGVLMIVYLYALTALWFPERLADEGRHHAEEAQEQEGMEHRAAEGMSWGRN